MFTYIRSRQEMSLATRRGVLSRLEFRVLPHIYRAKFCVTEFCAKCCCNSTKAAQWTRRIGIPPCFRQRNNHETECFRITKWTRATSKCTTDQFPNYSTSRDGGSTESRIKDGIAEAPRLQVMMKIKMPRSLFCMQRAWGERYVAWGVEVSRYPYLLGDKETCIPLRPLWRRAPSFRTCNANTETNTAGGLRRNARE